MVNAATFFDVIIIGGGPGGSTLAALLGQKGISTLIVEKDSFPRFKVGESLLPFSLDILKASGVLPKIEASDLYLQKFGAQFVDWQQEKEVYFDFSQGLDGGHTYAYEVERQKFDLDLLDHAIELGAQVLQPETVRRIVEEPTGVSVETDKQTLRCRYIVDASGRSAVISRKLKLRRRREEFNNIAVYGHFDGIQRSAGRRAGDIVIGVLPDHCWSWIIPLKCGKSSLGVVVDAKKFKGQPMGEDFLLSRLRCHSVLEKMTEGAVSVSSVGVESNYSEYSEQLVGDRWVLLGDAASFLDPVFSTGVHISLQSAEFASQLLYGALKTDQPLQSSQSGQKYSEDVLKGIGRFHSLLKIFYSDSFMSHMGKAMKREHTQKAFTSVVAGDVWNDNNELFQMGIL